MPAGGVVELSGDRDYPITRSRLTPGYMHVRIDSDVLISRRSEPGDDIIERNNRFDVYLKPQHADDAAIKRLSHFPGLPPVSILMPAH